jgi:8-oxo-dGTP diphosphatase
VSTPVVRRPAARVICLAGELVLLLRWRDPVGGAEFWEPPGGGLEEGEDWEAAARRELTEETGLVAGSLGEPVMVERDFAWEGTRRVGPEAFFLAAWPRLSSLRLEPDPALLGFAWVSVSAVAGLGAVEPPELADVVRPLRARPGPPSR